jgi:uncharacterized RDD family membrane protein YckC
MSSNSPEPRTGVYFKREDYAGLWRRLLIDAIDFPVVVALSAALLWGLVAAGLQPEDAPWIVLLLLASVWFGYFVALKRSRYRTLGYVIARARIVDLNGDRPGFGGLTLRLLFVTLGPMNALFDVLWMTGDPDRQALRDKFASTYVIRKDALPDGTGRIRHRTYAFWGMTFLFKEVSRGAGRASGDPAILG